MATSFSTFRRFAKRCSKCWTANVQSRSERSMTRKGSRRKIAASVPRRTITRDQARRSGHRPDLPLAPTEGCWVNDPTYMAVPTGAPFESHSTTRVLLLCEQCPMRGKPRPLEAFEDGDRARWFRPRIVLRINIVRVLPCSHRSRTRSRLCDFSSVAPPRLLELPELLSTPYLRGSGKECNTEVHMPSRKAHIRTGGSVRALRPELTKSRDCNIRRITDDVGRVIEWVWWFKVCSRLGFDSALEDKLPIRTDPEKCLARQFAGQRIEIITKVPFTRRPKDESNRCFTAVLSNAPDESWLSSHAQGQRARRIKNDRCTNEVVLRQLLDCLHEHAPSPVQIP